VGRFYQQNTNDYRLTELNMRVKINFSVIKFDNTFSRLTLFNSVRDVYKKKKLQFVFNKDNMLYI